MTTTIMYNVLVTVRVTWAHRWKWVIFRDPLPMTFTLFIQHMGLEGGVAWWYLTHLLSVLTANKSWIKIKLPLPAMIKSVIDRFPNIFIKKMHIHEP